MAYYQIVDIYKAMSERGYGQIAPHWYKCNKQFNIEIIKVNNIILVSFQLAFSLKLLG